MTSIESIERLQVWIQGTKNSIKSMSTRSDQCEDSVKTRRQGYQWPINENIFKTISKHEIWIQQELNGARKTNRWLIGLSKTIRRQHKGHTNTIYTTKSKKNFRNMKKEFNIQLSKAYRTPNIHKQRKKTTPWQTHHSQNTRNPTQEQNPKSSQRKSNESLIKEEPLELQQTYLHKT